MRGAEEVKGQYILKVSITDFLDKAAHGKRFPSNATVLLQIHI